MNKLKCWKLKHKTKKYEIYINEKLGETVPLWKGRPAENKKAQKYMKDHDSC